MTATVRAEPVSCPNLFQRLVSGARELREVGGRDVAEATLTGLRLLRDALVDYAHEIRAEPKRLLIVPRDTTLKRNAWDYFQEGFMNPWATAFNRPRRLSLWGSLAGYALAEQVGAGVVDFTEELAVQKGFRLRDQVPGGHYVWSLIPAGAITPVEAAEAISAHYAAMRHWRDSKPGKFFLPRAQALLKEGGIAKADLLRLDELGREIFAAHLGEAERVTALKAAIDADPRLARYSATQREVFSTYLWPRVEIQGFSDIRLARQILEAPIEVSAATGPLASIRALLETSGNVGVAYALAAEALNSPRAVAKKVEKKLDQARVVLPPEKLASAQRPDIPRHALRAELDRLGDGQMQVLEGELDRWKLLLSEPRLLEVAERWKRGEIDDTLALGAVEDWMRGVNGIYALIREAGPGLPLHDSTVIQLFGLENSTTLNPLLTEMKLALSRVIEAERLGSRAALECFRDGARLEIRTQREELEWVRAGLPNAEFIKKQDAATSRYLAEYKKVLESCATRAR